jgi:ABC-type glycerol-3-phosphate transport system substrate-binding protein
MKLTQRQAIIVVGGAVLVIGALFLFIYSLRKPTSSTAFTLTIWGTNSAKTFNDLIAPYVAGNSGNKITYTQIDPQDYDGKILAALAAGTGPDIFEIGNRALPRWQRVIAPLPPQFAQAFNLTTLGNDFPNVVGQDFVSGGQIYGLPFTIDTLAMIYNKDLFDSAGIATPPKTWDDVLGDIPKLRILGAGGQLSRAAAAIGGSGKSITNAPDIISLLMLQNGTQMTKSDFSAATFANTVSDPGAASGGSASPGLAAFNFYLQFGNAASPNYTWNDSMGDSRDSFIRGKTAILFDYASSLGEIKAKAPFLNLGVAAMPQLSGATININYPKYIGLVAAKMGNVSSAWQFILNLTTAESNEKIYASATGAVPALRTALAANAGDPALSVFAGQTLTARSWHEVDDVKVDGILGAAIGNVLNGATDPARALAQAQESVNEIARNQ